MPADSVAAATVMSALPALGFRRMIQKRSGIGKCARRTRPTRPGTRLNYSHSSSGKTRTRIMVMMETVVLRAVVVSARAATTQMSTGLTG